MRRNTSFDAALAVQAKWWPTLYSCRARILDHMFGVIGSGEKWTDGRLTDGTKSEKDRQRRFDRQNEAKQHIHAEIASTLFIPSTPRTPEQVAKVINDFDHPDVIRSEQDRIMSDRLGGFKEYRKRQGYTLFYPLCEQHSNCFTVPDDVRPDWLAGVREFLEMVIKWDDPQNVDLAKKAWTSLEDRFGPATEWHKRKRVRAVKPKEDFGCDAQIQHELTAKVNHGG